MAHFVGSSSTPPKNGGSAENDGASLAVLQFVAIAQGEWAVQAPQSPFRVGRVLVVLPFWCIVIGWLVWRAK